MVNKSYFMQKVLICSHNWDSQCGFFQNGKSRKNNWPINGFSRWPTNLILCKKSIALLIPEIFNLDVTHSVTPSLSHSLTHSLIYWILRSLRPALQVKMKAKAVFSITYHDMRYINKTALKCWAYLNLAHITCQFLIIGISVPKLLIRGF